MFAEKKLTLHLNNELKVDIFKGSFGDYYEMDGIYYDIHFPIEWAKEHRKLHLYDSSPGPINCADCYDLGHYNGVFIGYCMSCARDVFDYSRGYGMKRCGREDDNMEEINKKDIAYPLSSMWYKYMNNTLLNQIGDDYLKMEHEAFSESKDDTSSKTHSSMPSLIDLEEEEKEEEEEIIYKLHLPKNRLPNKETYKYFLSSSYY